MTKAIDAKRYQTSALGKATRRNWLLKRLYGITHADYLALLGNQNGCCALCSRRPEQERHGRLCVDHDHSKRIGDARFVRGILCRRHNDAIHKVGDNIAGVIQVLNYLRQS